MDLKEAIVTIERSISAPNGLPGSIDVQYVSNGNYSGEWTLRLCVARYDVVHEVKSESLEGAIIKAASAFVGDL